MPQSSHELLIPDHDFGFDTISDVEQPLDEALMAAGVGEVTGGGIGLGWYRLELALERPAEAVAVIRRLAASLSLPETTLLRATGADAAHRLDSAELERAVAAHGAASGPAQESGG